MRSFLARLAAAACLALAAPTWAWHVLINLSVEVSGPPSFWVEFPSGAAPFARDGWPPPPDVTLIDWDFGRLNDGDVVAFRLRDGTFVTDPGGPGPLVPGATEITAAERFVIRVGQPGASCPNAPGGAKQNPVPFTSEIATGCGVRFTSLDGTRVLSASATSGAPLVMRAVVASPFPAGETFQIFLNGLPPPLALSAPFHPTSRVASTVWFVDASAGDLTDGPGCKNPKGGPPRPCYRRHEGTDFPAEPRALEPGVDVIPIEVTAAAPGRVVAAIEGNFDSCFFHPLGNCGMPPINCPRPGDPPDRFVFCDGTPSKTANKVIVVQDDGLIVNYVHLKRGSVTVKKGDRVACGQVLGQFGSSGVSVLPHLHFDMARPPLCIDAQPGDVHCTPLAYDHEDAVWGRSGARHDDPRLVDPYAPKIEGRDSLWAAWEANGLPRLTCTHPTQVTRRTIAGRGGIGDPCVNTPDCNPGTVCLSSASCGYLADAGGMCGRTTDCKLGLSCSSRVCVSAAPPAPPAIVDPPDCPQGWSRKCVLPCFDDRGSCKVWKPVRGRMEKVDCAKVCAP